MPQKVIIGLSGGVDSSVAAYLLQQKGFDVEGLFMINWKDSSVTLSGDCSWEEDLIVARLSAKKLSIPLHVVDSSEAYMNRVASYIFEEYAKGRTPNPDVLCNRDIKFDVFIQKASELGADWFATGHYCRKDVLRKGNKSIYRLLAGSDPNKDQSYFLCQLTQEQLKNALFPIGHLMKPEVRRIATDLELPTADRRDSQGICFVGKVDLPVFLQQQLKPEKGDIIEIEKGFYKSDPASPERREYGDKELGQICSAPEYRPSDGKKVGEHDGAWYFTIGQRKGLDVGGTAEPLFVISTDTDKNIVYVGQGQDHPGLFRKGLFIRKDEIHWLRPDLSMEAGEERSFRVRIRYRQELQNAKLIMRADGLYVLFERPQRGITPGQFAAWYERDELCGSGVIA